MKGANLDWPLLVIFHATFVYICYVYVQWKEI